MRVVYSGHVQGVGFRYTVKRLAQGYEVTGQIRNLPDGGVEVCAEGMHDELESFAQAVRQSELEGYIRDAQVSWGLARGEFRGFEIVG